MKIIQTNKSPLGPAESIGSREGIAQWEQGTRRMVDQASYGQQGRQEHHTVAVRAGRDQAWEENEKTLFFLRHAARVRLVFLRFSSELVRLRTLVTYAAWLWGPSYLPKSVK